MSVGVLAMAYGTPRDRADIAAYYTDIRRGAPPPGDLLAALVARYDAIGGTFPLRAATEAQCAALQAELDRRRPAGFRVSLGCKHSDPRVEDGVAGLAAAGVDRMVGVVLAPHYSAYSVGQYADRAAAAARMHGLDVTTIPSWHLLPAYLDFLAAAVREALAGLPPGAEVVFTAHSLPARIADSGDLYPGQLAETAAAVAERAGLASWSVGWQSAGRTAEAWLGPDILAVVRDRAVQGAPGLLTCPCGFVSDHLEVAYDLDIEAAGLAAELGLPFARTHTVGTDPGVIAGLADLVLAR
ncbi:MAG TPA: ferrochelatase [Mycobacteriales bacterium]|nr:ferrochelatase [Mycobacteriales bacterium]